MGFRIGFTLGLFAFVLMFANLSTAHTKSRNSSELSESCQAISWIQTDDPSCIIVFLNDSVGLDRAVLRRAEGEATRLFRPAGIRIEWRNCADTRDCRRPPRSNEFVLHIVAQGTVRSDFVFGEAFLGPDGKGKYADVFFHRLREARETNIAQLLGAVAAHELGHLLLGSHSHALMGIMEPTWGPDSLRRISMGNLTFTPEQQQSMRRRLRAEESAVRLAREIGSLGLQ